MPNWEAEQESKLQRYEDDVDIIYILTDDVLNIFRPYQDLFDNSGLNCRKILVNPIIMEWQLSQAFQYHAPYTKIYVFTHGDVSDTGRLLLSLGDGNGIEAAELIHIINTMTVYPVHMSFISCHSGVLLLESHLKEDILFLKNGSTIIVSGPFTSIGVMLFTRIECEVKELKNFLWNENYSYQKFIESSVVKGILSCPEDFQFLMMIDFKQELIEEKEIRQAKKKASGYKHREGQSKQSFFQSQPLLLGSDSGRAAQEFQLPSTARSYLTMSNATLV